MAADAEAAGWAAADERSPNGGEGETDAAGGRAKRAFARETAHGNRKDETAGASGPWKRPVVSGCCMDDTYYHEAIAAEVRARSAACEILGVGEGAAPNKLKPAWRRRCMETHPDRNPGDPDAARRFRLVNCAYRLLAEGVPCDEMPLEDVEAEPEPWRGGYNIHSRWGFFLWWRDTFF